MPVLEEAEPQRAPVLIEPSAPAELFWVLRAIADADAERLPAAGAGDARLRGQVRRLWEDDGRDFSEAIILAQLTGHLFDPSPDAFLARVAAPVAVDEEELALRSETGEDRTRLLGRLRRLEGDGRARAHYARVLTEAWELARADWDEGGLAEVIAACQARRDRAARGVPVRELIDLKPGHGGMFLRQQEEAAERGELGIAPVRLARLSLFLDLPGRYFTGVPTRADGLPAAIRARSAPVARRLKVLADPTRLAVLQFLAHDPSTISETARAFGLAQPTVSAHFRLLREAGLVVPARREGKTAFEVDRERVQALLRDAACDLLPEA